MVTEAMVTNLIDKGRDQGTFFQTRWWPRSRTRKSTSTSSRFYSSLVAEGIEVLDQAPLKPVARPREVLPSAPRTGRRTPKTRVGVGDSVRLYLQEIGDTDLLTMQEGGLALQAHGAGQDRRRALAGPDLTPEASGPRRRQARRRAGSSASDPRQPQTRRLSRQEVRRSRSLLPRSHSGRQHRPHEGDRQI